VYGLFFVPHANYVIHLLHNHVAKLHIKFLLKMN